MECMSQPNFAPLKRNLTSAQSIQCLAIHISATHFRGSPRKVYAVSAVAMVRYKFACITYKKACNAAVQTSVDGFCCCCCCCCCRCCCCCISLLLCVVVVVCLSLCICLSVCLCVFGNLSVLYACIFAYIHKIP